MRLASLAGLGAALSCALLGCGEDNGAGKTTGEELGEVCAEQRVTTVSGRDVVVCERPFEEAPHVRLPENTATRVFAELRTEEAVDTDGETYSFRPSLEEHAELDKDHAVTLYAVTLSGGAIESYVPAVVFDDRLFLEPFAGQAYEGKITKRVAEGEWEDEATLDVRMELGTALREDPSQAGFYQAEVTFVNLSEGVTSAAGGCMPSLLSHGAEAPFSEGVDVLWKAGRVPSMHGYGDDQFVFSFFEDGVSTGGSIMSIGWYRGPLDLVNGTAHSDGEYSGIGHGTPDTNPTVVVSAAAGGGEPCTAE